MKFRFDNNLSIFKKSGFTLVELMVAVGGASIISLAVATLLTNLKEQEKSILSKAEQRGEVFTIQSALANSGTCTATLGGLNPVTGSTVPTGIRDASGATLYAVNQVDASNLFSYLNFSISGYVQDPETPLPLRRGRGQLFIRMQKANNAQGAREMLESIDINFTLNASNQVVSCHTAGTTPDSLWRFSPVNVDRIFYRAFIGTTHVGIGEDNPTGTLDVSGTIRTSHGANNGFKFTENPGGGGGDVATLTYQHTAATERTSLVLQNGNDPRGANQDVIQLRAQGGIIFETDLTAGAYTERMRIDSSGNVGIGNNVASELLTVGDDIGNVSTNKAVIIGDTSNNAQLILTRDDSNLVSTIWDNASGATEFVTSNGGTIYDFSLVLQNGRVGLGTISPTESLHVEGNILANNGVVESTRYHWTSDSNLKNIIAPAAGLDAIEKLNGYLYSWKTNGQKTQGVLAQEVKEVLPDLVRVGNEHMSVNYFGLIAPLIESIKELEAEQDMLLEKLEYLESELAAVD